MVKALPQHRCKYPQVMSAVLRPGLEIEAEPPPCDDNDSPKWAVAPEEFAIWTPRDDSPYVSTRPGTPPSEWGVCSGCNCENESRSDDITSTAALTVSDEGGRVPEKLAEVIAQQDAMIENLLSRCRALELQAAAQHKKLTETERANKEAHELRVRLQAELSALEAAGECRGELRSELHDLYAKLKGELDVLKASGAITQPAALGEQRIPRTPQMARQPCHRGNSSQAKRAAPSTTSAPRQSPSQQARQHATQMRGRERSTRSGSVEPCQRTPQSNKQKQQRSLVSPARTLSGTAALGKGAGAAATAGLQGGCSARTQPHSPASSTCLARRPSRSLSPVVGATGASSVARCTTGRSAPGGGSLLAVAANAAPELAVQHSTTPVASTPGAVERGFRFVARSTSPVAAIGPEAPLPAPSPGRQGKSSPSGKVAAPPPLSPASPSEALHVQHPTWSPRRGDGFGARCRGGLQMRHSAHRLPSQGVPGDASSSLPSLSMIASAHLATASPTAATAASEPAVSSSSTLAESAPHAPSSAPVPSAAAQANGAAAVTSSSAVCFSQACSSPRAVAEVVRVKLSAALAPVRQHSSGLQQLVEGDMGRQGKAVWAFSQVINCSSA